MPAGPGAVAMAAMVSLKMLLMPHNLVGKAHAAQA
jgi:hypothetical protein